MGIGEFLCRDDTERRRITELGRSIRPGAPFMLALFMVAGLAGTPAYGWLPLLPPALAFAAYGVIWVINPPRRERPELLVAGALVFAEAMMATSLAIARGPRGYGLVILTMPVLLAALVFPKRVVIASMAIGAATMSAVLLTTDIGEVRHTPPVAFVSIFVLCSLAVTAYVIRGLDDASRRSAFLDELTGALNRAALTPKLAELSYRASLTNEPVAVIVADIDHFKDINDARGHAHGDAVLREIVRRLNMCSGAEPIYRLGGDEFVVLLPGLNAAAAYDLAVGMCHAIATAPVDGTTVTMSFGVAASLMRGPFDFDACFARADAALYAAKREGRDRVHVAPHDAQGVPQDAQAVRDRADLAAGGPAGQGHPSAGQGHPSADQQTVTDELEREFTIDMNRRLMLLSLPLVLGATIVIVASAPWFGWHTLIGPAVGAIPYYLLSWDAHRFRRPSRALFAGWAIFQTAIAAGFVAAHGAPLFALPLFVLLVPGGCAVFRSRRTTALGVGYTALLMTAVSFGLQAHRVLDNPAVLLFPLALLCEAGYVGAAVGRSAVAFRGAGIVDELTGLLNRTALGTRLIELESQATDTPRRVAIVLADLDRFKQLNDSHGHSCGDEVLRAVSDRIHGSLRSFDSAYRLGGEEFLLLLPDADLRAARQVAERLRVAVASQPCGEQAVSISLGVAVTAPGAPFDYTDIFGRADKALYNAKHAGRDRVWVDEGSLPAVAPADRGGDRRAATYSA